MKRLSKSASTVKMEVMIKMVSHKLKGEIDSDENAQVELGQNTKGEGVAHIIFSSCDNNLANEEWAKDKLWRCPYNSQGNPCWLRHGNSQSIFPSEFSKMQQMHMLAHGFREISEELPWFLCSFEWVFAPMQMLFITFLILVYIQTDEELLSFNTFKSERDIFLR